MMMRSRKEGGSFEATGRNSEVERVCTRHVREAGERTQAIDSGNSLSHESKT